MIKAVGSPKKRNNKNRGNFESLLKIWGLCNMHHWLMDAPDRLCLQFKPATNYSNLEIFFKASTKVYKICLQMQAWHKHSIRVQSVPLPFLFVSDRGLTAWLAWIGAERNEAVVRKACQRNGLRWRLKGRITRNRCCRTDIGSLRSPRHNQLKRIELH